MRAPCAALIEIIREYVMPAGMQFSGMNGRRTMNQSELIKRVGASMYQQINNIGYATAVQTLMDMQILSKEDYPLPRMDIRRTLRISTIL